MNELLIAFLDTLTPEQKELCAKAISPHFDRYQKMEELLLDPDKLSAYKADFFSQIFPGYLAKDINIEAQNNED